MAAQPREGYHRSGAPRPVARLTPAAPRLAIGDWVRVDMLETLYSGQTGQIVELSRCQNRLFRVRFGEVTEVYYPAALRRVAAPGSDDVL